MKFYTNILIKGPKAPIASKHSWYFDCKPEELQKKVRERFDSNENFQGCKLKGISFIQRTDGPTEFFPGTVTPILNQYLICWI